MEPRLLTRGRPANTWRIAATAHTRYRLLTGLTSPHSHGPQAKTPEHATRANVWPRGRRRRNQESLIRTRGERKHALSVGGEKEVVQMWIGCRWAATIAGVILGAVVAMNSKAWFVWLNSPAKWLDISHPVVLLNLLIPFMIWTILFGILGYQCARAVGRIVCGGAGIATSCEAKS
jgi:hypothetical protein